ncbi:MAG TPA: glycoside hydrolase family 47 protein [Bacteroidales bacterium]|nr:glycoside hydrolase family 47 protein [Bacteroidales bacterium]HPS63334.1 glycoside hydrolase family 47 protein [Bacteroidales bacterium]
MKQTRLFLATACIVAFTSFSYSQTSFPDREKRLECRKIRSACHTAWKAYLAYARGYDELKPLSRQGHNWYGTSLLMTPVDAFDTFILMGMKKEAAEAETLVTSGLRFDLDREVQLFEVSIRLLGGLLSSYEWSGNQRFLDLATDLGKRLLPAFSSPTGMPYRYVNLVTGATRDPLSNPAEIGTYLLEFGKLTALTGDPVYYRTARKAAMEVYRRRSDNDLVGTTLDVNTGEWHNKECQIGARIDSYFEYLYKAGRLLGDRECMEAWQVHNRAILKYLFTRVPEGAYFTRVEMNSGKETTPLYGALDAFYAGILALSGDTASAAQIQQGNFAMWERYGIEPEEFNFRTGKVTDPAYVLRPENLESCFYLYRATHDSRYLQMGKRMTDDILQKCRAGAGYASLHDVTTGKQSDKMESFFLAETLKYAYLLFAPENTLDLEKYVFTTEAHPLKVMEVTR